MALLFFFLVTVSGCFTLQVYTESKMPLIEAPERPQVPAEPSEWTVREKILVDYANRLEAAIRAYNDEARKHNKQHGYAP